MAVSAIVVCIGRNDSDPRRSRASRGTSYANDTAETTLEG